MNNLERRVLHAWLQLHEATAGNVHVSAWRASSDGEQNDGAYYVNVRVVVGGVAKNWTTPDFWEEQGYYAHLHNVAAALDVCLLFVRSRMAEDREALIDAVKLVAVHYTTVSHLGVETTRLYGVYGSRKEATQGIYPEYVRLQRAKARDPYSVPRHWSFCIEGDGFDS